MNLACLSRITNTHGTKGGMEYHLQALAEGLVQRGHQMTVFTTAHPSGLDQEKINGVNYVYLPSPAGKYRPAWWSTSQQTIQTTPFDLVWAEGWAGEAVAKLPNRPPLVSILHGTAWSEMQTRLQQWRSPKMLALAALMAWRHLTWRAHLQQADHLIAVSALVAQDTRRISGTTPLTIIPNGIPVHRFKQTFDDSLRQQLGIPTQAPVLISASRLSREKGVHLAIQAMAQLTNAHLVIAGQGPDETTLQTLTQNSDASSRIHFVGFVPNQELPRYFHMADLFVLPTLRHEGLPITILEALASGLPIVATDIGGIKAAVTHQQEGLLFPMGDLQSFIACLRQLIDNPTQQTQMSQAAQQKAEAEYSLGTMVQRTEAVFQQVVQP